MGSGLDHRFSKSINRLLVLPATLSLFLIFLRTYTQVFDFISNLNSNSNSKLNNQTSELQHHNENNNVNNNNTNNLEILGGFLGVMITFLIISKRHGMPK